MSEIRYRAYRKKQPGGRHVWGVLRREGRKQNFRSYFRKWGSGKLASSSQRDDCACAVPDTEARIVSTTSWICSELIPFLPFQS